MNKAVTEGLILMPPPFADGLNVWSSGDGTPGSPTYDGAPNAAYVPSDPDFEGCLELLKTSATQQLRWMGQTPILPGCYLRVTARIKAVSGALPSVRIAGYAANGAGNPVPGVTLAAAPVALTTYGEIVEVSAIIGTGSRGGVDLNWAGVSYGHVGLDLTGANGGLVRIDDLTVEDVTSFWLRDMMDWVDVRDHGAVGDGVTNDHAAFVAAAADALATDRALLVSDGTYYIGSTLTVEVPVRFQGKLSMPDAARLELTRSYDYATYASAFASEGQALRKALQALFHFTDHDTLDLNGRRILLDAPIDVAATAGLTSYAIRRLLKNGLIEINEGPAWETTTVTSQATYATAQATTLSNVANIASIPVGARVLGSGVGREVYVRAVNVGAGTLTLSKPLYDAVGTQVFTFERYKYVLDFSGFSTVHRFEIAELEFQCKEVASCVCLPVTGQILTFRDCTFNRPANKAITSIGTACQAMQVDNCNFMSAEMAVPSQNRVSVAVNANTHDVKLRNNIVQRFGIFAVLGGSYNQIIGNHFYQGDDQQNAVRQPGIVLTASHAATTIMGNYIDNCFVEMSNEHDPFPDFSNEFSFSALTVTGNVFLVSNVISSFRFLVVKPRGPGHFVSGMTVQGNVFRSVNAVPTRVDGVDTSHADLDYSRFRNILWTGNTYNGITTGTESPMTLRHDQGSAAGTWVVSTGDKLPFQGWARTVSGLVMEGAPRGPANELRTSFPYVAVQQGTAFNQVHLVWPSATQGRAVMTVRVDNPI